ncbi:unnamed protein product [Calypogeia fissa]
MAEGSSGGMADDRMRSSRRKEGLGIDVSLGKREMELRAERRGGNRERWEHERDGGERK